MDFYAYFWNSEVYIQEKYKFSSNEILTKYLNTNYLKKIEELDLFYQLCSLQEKIKLKEDMSYDNIEKYDIDDILPKVLWNNELSLCFRVS